MELCAPASRGEKKALSLKLRNSYAALSVSLFVVFAAISKLSPLFGDDWLWSVRGFERLSSWTGYGNARWAGNIIVTYITNYEWLRILVEASVHTALIVTMIAILRTFGHKSFYKPAILVLATTCLLPIRMWREVLLWTAGFANYTVSVLLLMIILLIFLPTLLRKEKANTFLSLSYFITAPILFALAFASQFFLETQTLFLVLFALFLVVWSIVHKVAIIPPLSLLAGSVTGAAIMFSNPAYRTIFQGEHDIYSRTVGTDLLSNFLEFYPTSGIEIAFLPGAFLLILFSLSLMFAMNRTKIQQVLSGYCVMFCFGLLFWTSMSNLSLEDVPAVALVAAVASILFMIATVTCLFLQKDRATFVYALMVFSAFAMILVIFLQGTFGFRNVFFAFLLLNLVTSGLLLSIKNLPRIVFTALLALIISFALVLGYGLYSNHQVMLERERIIQNAIQADHAKIELPAVRFPILGFHLNTRDDFWIGAMKDYHGINKDVEVAILRD